MKFKKVFLIFLFSITLLFLESCQTIRDYIPSKYGSWENNYIYRNNGRVKTTGDDYETLISTVVIDSDELEVNRCVNSKIVGDDIYMILELNTEDYSQYYFDEYCVLLSYNIRTKNYKIIFTDNTMIYDEMCIYYRPYELLEINSNHIVLFAYETKDFQYGNNFISHEYFAYEINFNGELINRIDDSFDNCECILDNKLYLCPKATRIYLKRGILNDGIDLGYETRYDTYKYINDGLVEGILFIYSGSYSSNGEFGYIADYTRLRFYDLKNEKWYSDLEVDSKNYFVSNYQYIFTYEVTVVERWCGAFDKQKASIHSNNELFKIVIDSEKISLESIKKFKDKKNYTIASVAENSILYEVTYYKHISCESLVNDKITKYYEYDIKNDKNSEVNSKDNYKELIGIYEAYNEYKNGITCGDYTYFMHKEEVSHGFMTSSYYIYILKRYNSKTNEIDVMQIIPLEYDEDVKYSKEFWKGNDYTRWNFDNASSDEYINNFTVRNY